MQLLLELLLVLVLEELDLLLPQPVMLVLRRW